MPYVRHGDAEGEKTMLGLRERMEENGSGKGGQAKRAYKLRIVTCVKCLYSSHLTVAQGGGVEETRPQAGAPG